MPASEPKIPDDDFSFKDVAQSLNASGLRVGAGTPPAAKAAKDATPPAPLPSAPAAETQGTSLTGTAISPRHQLEAWLALMVKGGASDLILRAGGRPSLRTDGKIGFLPGRVPSSGALL